MKKIILLFAACILLAACSKDNADPDMASEVFGTYEVTQMELAGKKYSLPANGISAGITIERISDNEVLFKFSSTIDGVKSNSSEQMDLNRENGKIVLYAENKEFGYFVGKNFLSDVTTDDGNRIILKAYRK